MTDLAPSDGSSQVEDLTSEDLLDAAGLAEWLKVTPAWVQEMARNGDIPAFKLGNRYWRFSKRQVGSWLIERQGRTFSRRSG